MAPIIRHLLFTLIAALVAGGTLANWLVEAIVHSGNRFSLHDISTVSKRVTLLGAMVGLGASLAIDLVRKKQREQQLILKFLLLQAGRTDLSDDYRAAFAFVSQELKERECK